MATKVYITARLKPLPGTEGRVQRIVCGAERCPGEIGEARRDGGQWIVTNTTRNPDKPGYSDYGGVYRALKMHVKNRGETRHDYLHKPLAGYQERETPHNPVLPAVIYCPLCDRPNQVNAPG